MIFWFCPKYAYYSLANEKWHGLFHWLKTAIFGTMCIFEKIKTKQNNNHLNANYNFALRSRMRAFLLIEGWNISSSTISHSWEKWWTQKKNISNQNNNKTDSDKCERSSPIQIYQCRRLDETTVLVCWPLWFNSWSMIMVWNMQESYLWLPMNPVIRDNNPVSSYSNWSSCDRYLCFTINNKIIENENNKLMNVNLKSNSEQKSQKRNHGKILIEARILVCES